MLETKAPHEILVIATISCYELTHCSRPDKKLNLVMAFLC